jgi:dihydroneopterin aldolase
VASGRAVGYGGSVADRITLEGLFVQAGIGVYPHEHGASVDYDALARLCREVARSQHHDLIETVAEKIADRVLALPRVARVRVRVEKPGAVPDARAVAVELTRPWSAPG